MHLNPKVKEHFKTFFETIYIPYSFKWKPPSIASLTKKKETLLQIEPQKKTKPITKNITLVPKQSDIISTN